MLLKIVLGSVVASGLALMLALAPRYPGTAPTGSGSAASQLVRSLNHALHTVDSELEGLRLVSACRLRVRPVGAEPIPVDLMSVSVRTGADERSGDLQLYLKPEAGEHEMLMLSTDSWPLWAAAHSDINQLRALCAQGRKTPD